MSGGKKKALVAILIIVMIVSAGILYFILFNKVDARKYYESIIDNSVNFLTQNVEKTKNNFKGIMSLKMSTDVEDDEAKALLCDTGLSVNYAYNYTTQKTLLDISTTYKSKNLLSGSAYLANDKLYFNIKDVLNNYYFLNLEDYDSLFQQSVSSDLAATYKSFSKVLKSTITDDLYSTENENGYQLVSIKIPQDKYKEFVKNLLNNLKSNQEFVNNLSMVLDKTNTEVRTIMDNELDNDVKAKTISVTIYLKNKVVNKAIINISSEENQYSLVLDSIKKGSISFDLSKGNESIFKGNINYENNNNESKAIIKFEYEKVTYTISNDINYGEDFSAPTITNAKDFNTISDEELQSAYEKIASNETINDYIKVFYAISSKNIEM